MCDMCYGYIYDVIRLPIHDTDVLYKHLHYPSLLRHLEEITYCFQRALNIFDNNPLFFMIMDDSDEDIINESNHILKEKEEDKLVWKKFLQYYPTGSAEINYAMNICLDNSVFRKTSEPARLIEQFLIDKLRLLLSILPDIHTAHIEKNTPEPSRSLGSAPLQKIVDIRSKLGLSVSNWEREKAIDIITTNYRN
jgi:hypothetical protein